MTHSWKTLGRGVGKRPDGVRDGDIVRRIHDDGTYSEMVEDDCLWFFYFEYELRIDQPTADAGNVHEAQSASNADVLREALKFYADQASYCKIFIPNDPDGPSSFAPVLQDDGRMARSALAATEPAPMKDV